MGWLRLVGSLNLEVFFAEYRLFYRALLQKRLGILRSLLIEAAQYIYACSNDCLYHIASADEVNTPQDKMRQKKKILSTPIATMSMHAGTMVCIISFSINELKLPQENVFKEKNPAMGWLRFVGSLKL